MRDPDQRVLPQIVTRTESDCRHALARDLIRICHAHGPQRVALDSLLAEYGLQIAPREGAGDDSHATAVCSKPVPRLALAQAPDSDGGTALTIRELLEAEVDLRASHRMTGKLIARIDSYRKHGSIAA